MPQRKSVKIEVSNFGPVKEGEFDLKPLTIFIGPNNSGKSYMALLVYALARALVITREEYLDYPLSRREPRSYPEGVRKWLLSVFTGDVSEPVGIPSDVQGILEPLQKEYGKKLQEEASASLREYFGCEDVKELRRPQDGAGALSVKIIGKDKNIPLLSLRAGATRRSTKVATPELGTYRLRPARFLAFARWRNRSSMTNPDEVKVDDQSVRLAVDEIMQGSWLDFLAQNGFPDRGSYYLPSARSGILQGWQLFASIAVQAVRRGIGLRRFEVPPLSGVAGDFLQILWDRISLAESRGRQRNQMLGALELLESRVFRGQVAFAEGKSEQPLILYKSGAVQVPLQRASSMAAELAPLDLWLKYLLASGDLLIIDEPEAHLHPENQRMIARVLVRMAKAGVRVVCPTHSSLILHQVSNLILASQLSPEERQRQNLDLTEDDLISSEDVGVYHFDVQEDGTHIKPVPIDTEFGISEEEFVRVAEAMGDETYRLTLAKVEETDIHG